MTRVGFTLRGVCSGVGVAQFFLTRYLGYLVKAVRVAVIVEAVTKGSIPVNQVQ